MHKNTLSEPSIKNASSLRASRKNDDLVQSVVIENKQIQEGEEFVLNVEMLKAASQDTQLKFNIKGAIELADDIGNLTFSNGVVANADGTITVPRGVTSFQVRINTLTDMIYEKSENMVVNIGQHKIKAKLKDAVSVEEITVVNDEGKATEGENLVFNVVLSSTTNNSVTMKLHLKGQATRGEGKDFSDLVFSNGVINNADGTITIPEGVMSFDIVVPTIHDGEFERKESLKLKLGGVTAKAKIADAIEVEDISVANAKGKAYEGENLVFDISLKNSSSENVTMDLKLKGKSTTGNESDFSELLFTDGVVANQDGTITIPAGVSSFQIIAPTLFDGIKEKAESLTVLLANKKATGKIVDSEELATVTSVVTQNGDAEVTEGEALNFQVSLSGASHSAINFSFMVAGSAELGIDYSELIFTNGVTYDFGMEEITVPAGVSEFMVSILTIDDQFVETNESVVLVVDGKEAVAAIIDNDESVAVSNVTVLNVDDAVVEGEALNFQVGLSGTSDNPINLSLMVVGSAELGIDYSELVFTNGVTYDFGMEEIIVPAGVSEFMVSILTIDDAFVEKNESVVLVVDGKEAVAEIIDNDESVAVSNVTVLNEGDAVVEGEALNFQVDLSRVSSNAISFSLMVAGSAQQSADYSQLIFNNGVTYNALNSEIIVPAGVSEFGITIPTIDDFLDEYNESVVLVVDGVDATATILDNDEAFVVIIDPIISIDSLNDSVTEGEAPSFRVNLGDVKNSPTNFLFTITGTADNTDYLQPIFTNGVVFNSVANEITVPAGVGDFEVSIPTFDDQLVESDESILLSVGNINVVATIVDNDQSVINDDELSDTLIEKTDSVKGSVYTDKSTEMTELISDLNLLAPQANDTIPSVIIKANNAPIAGFDDNQEELSPEISSKINLNMNDLLEDGCGFIDTFPIDDMPVCGLPMSDLPVHYEQTQAVILIPVDKSTFIEDMINSIIIE